MIGLASQWWIIKIAFKNGTCLGKDGKYGKRHGNELGLRIGTLNVRTLRGKTEELVDLVKRRRIDIMGLAETKWKGEGVMKLREGYTLYWAGNQEGRRNGVGLVVRKGLREEVEVVSDRIVRARVWTKEKVMEVIQVYAPQVGCSVEEKDEFEEELQRQIGVGKFTVVMGDLNAHVGSDRRGYEEVLGAEGWGNRNVEGKRLLDLCKRNNLMVGNSWFKKRESHKITWYSSDLNRRSVVDYMLYTEDFRERVKDVKVIPSEGLDSDHRLVVMSVKVKWSKGEGVKQDRRIRVWRLKDKVVREQYREILRRKLPKDELLPVEGEWTRFRDGIVGAAEEVCGRTSGRKKKKETPWWTDKVKEIIVAKNKAFRKWFQERTEEARAVYKRLRREANKCVAEEKKEWMEKWADILEEDAKGDKRVLYGLVKSKRRIAEEDTKMVDERGVEVEGEVELGKMWRRYFEELLNPGDIEAEEEVVGQNRGEEEEEKDLTWNEVEENLRRMKKGKAAGVDELVMEMITEAGEIGIHWLYRVLRVVWKEVKTPNDWKKAMIIPIFKKGSRKECKNYRGISLMCQCAKLFEKILERRIREKIRDLREEQYGFRPGRSTTDLIFAVRQLQEKQYEYGKDLIMAFLDMEKAYDRVRRGRVWEALGRKGVETITIERVKEMYRDSRSCVKLGGSKSGWLCQKTGLRQGSALSPLLFILVMDELMKGIAEKIGEDKMKVMAFADDLMVWGNEVGEVQEQLDAWVEEGTQFGMKFNAGKSEYIVTARQERDEENGLRLGTKEMKRVNCFKYLGSVIQEDGRLDCEVNERGRQAGIFLKMTGGLVRSKWVPKDCKKIIYRAYYVPILTYGAETWTLGRRDISRIQASEMRFLRSSMGITRRDRIRNEDIRGRVGEKPLVDGIEVRRLKWFGHMKRMESSRIPRKIHDSVPEGRRFRGRPRRRWIDGVKEGVERRGTDWTTVLEERTWEDRLKWRRLCTRQTQ